MQKGIRPTGMAGGHCSTTGSSSTHRQQWQQWRRLRGWGVTHACPGSNGDPRSAAAAAAAAEGGGWQQWQQWRAGAADGCGCVWGVGCCAGAGAALATLGLCHTGVCLPWDPGVFRLLWYFAHAFTCLQSACWGLILEACAAAAAAAALCI